jgi:hypothetical protein
MKNFWLLFSILILTLSVLPCGDNVECKDGNNIEISQTNNHETHNHDNEQCAPFCSCACCGTQIANYFQPTIIYIPILSKSIKKQLPTYKSILSSNFYGSIWQPPQIV